jgi:O-antigen ligase
LLVGGAGAVAAALVSGLIVVDLKLGLALLLGLIIVPIALARIQVAVCIWVAVLFFSRVGGVSQIPDHLLEFIIACWIALLLSRRSSIRFSLAVYRPIIALVVCFLAWQILTVAWAPVPGAAGENAKDLIFAGLGLLVILGTFTERKHLRWLAIAFVLGATLTVLYGLAKGGLSTSGASAVTNPEGRLQAGEGDPNYLAAVLVPAIMLAVGLTFGRSRMQQALLTISIVVLAIGLAATQSRGGLIAAVVGAGGAIALWRGRRFAVALMLLIAGGVTGGFFLADPSDFTRIDTPNGGSGRSDIWEVALRILHAHPFFGIGLAQFPEVSPRYVAAPGALNRVADLVDQHIVVHNLYLQLWVETGIPGLLLFIALIVVSMWGGWRSIGSFVAVGDEAMSALARLALLATLSTVTAAFFLSDITIDQVWVVLALGFAMSRVSESVRHDAVMAIEPFWPQDPPVGRALPIELVPRLG